MNQHGKLLLNQDEDTVPYPQIPQMFNDYTFTDKF